MKIFLILILVCLGVGISNAQNLVPNPSFEDTVNCPNSMGQVTKAKFWYSLFNSPDYFHECAPMTQFSVPANSFGFQYANTGEAYMGLLDYNTVDTLYREVIGAFLNSPLTIGEKYFVNLKASLAWNPNQGANAPTNKLGILFSVQDYLSSPPPIGNFSQIYSETIISDSINWTTIKGSFVADSNYSFFSIGNFFNNSNTDTLHFINSSWYGAYYYIDDVCVSTDSIFCEDINTINPLHFDGEIFLYPNPASEKLFIKNFPLTYWEIQILTIEGKSINPNLFQHENTTTIDISQFQCGMYFLVLRTEKSTQIEKFIKSNY